MLMWCLFWQLKCIHTVGLHAVTACVIFRCRECCVSGYFLTVCLCMLCLSTKTLKLNLRADYMLHCEMFATWYCDKLWCLLSYSCVALLMAAQVICKCILLVYLFLFTQVGLCRINPVFNHDLIASCRSLGSATEAVKTILIGSLRMRPNKEYPQQRQKFVQSPFNHHLSRYFLGLFPGWICEINPPALGNAPSDISG